MITVTTTQANQTINLGKQAGTISEVRRGDGSTNSSSSHKYAEPGTYVIVVSGKDLHFKLPKEVYDVIQRGRNQWSSMDSMFQGNTNITKFSAKDKPNLTNVQKMNSMFE